MVVLYGSQTGTAQEIARNLAAEALARGFRASVSSANELGFANVSRDKTPVLVLVCSSTGDGDPPDNAANFFASARRKAPEGAAAPPLAGVAYTVLGLGDSNYTRFMYVPRSLKKSLAELGAREFYACAEADEVEGVENVVEPWTEGIWPALQRAVDAAAAGGAGGPADAGPPAAQSGAAAMPAKPSTPEAPTPATAQQLEAAATAIAGDGLADGKPSEAVQPSEAPAAAGADGADGPQAVSDAVTNGAQLPRADASDARTEPAAAGGDIAPAAAQGPSPMNGASAATAAPAAAAVEQDDAASVSSPRPGSSVSEADQGPSTPGGTLRKSVEAIRLSKDVARRSVERNRRSSTDSQPSSRLQAKPINVNFPKRDETVVKRKDEQSYGLLMGLAPVGVDTKGAPALLPCRIRLAWEKDAAAARAVVQREAGQPSREQLQHVDPDGMYSAAQPFWSHIVDARYETALWSDRKVLHIDLGVRGSGMHYRPGDSIGVLPVNPPDLVANLLKRLNKPADAVLTVQAVQGSAPAHLPSPASLGFVLSRCVDLTGPTKKSVLRLLAEHCHDAAERRTLTFFCAKAGKDAYAHEVAEHQPSLLDLLVRFPSCSPPLDALLDALPPLTPRMYSVSSSQRHVAPATGGGAGGTPRGPANKDKLSVALSVVRFKTRYGTRTGVASTWLDRLAHPYSADAMGPPAEPVLVPIFLKRGGDFRLPDDLAAPIIMIGPGTGVAPFRGFLQERRALAAEQGLPRDAVGAAWLFFGCRREDEDYLYKDDLEAFVADGTLSKLLVAFSRAQADKVYVQDLLKQHGEAVWALVQAGAYVYVCGDGAGMAKDVHAALQTIAMAHGGMGADEAAAFFTQLAQEQRRYLRDIWSA